ncbi:MAG TPA: hypothetical protein PK340_05135 [Bacilli bacterium]|nr:hypothetical protein [Bacilli bacterium]
MKKILSYFAVSLALFSSALFISGCKAMDVPKLAKNINLPLPLTNYENEPSEAYMIDVSGSQIKTLIDSKASFLLYVGNDYCTSCLAFKDAFLSYIIETELLVYKYDNIASASDYEQMQTNHPGVFPMYPVTPSLYFFKDGELRTRQDGNTRMFELATLRPIMKSYADIINVMAIHDEALVSSLPNQDGIYFAYNRSSNQVRTFYNSTLFPYLVKHDTTLYQLEVSLNPLLQDALVSEFALDTTLPELFTIIDGAIISTASLVDHSETDLLEYYIDSLATFN